MLPRALGPELERLSSAMSAAYTARPITQGAAVVLPRRPSVTRLSQLPPDEAADLFATAAANCAAHADGAQGFNWSMKDSWSLGAPEPEQLHLHVVPRFAPTEEGMFCRDFRENDAVYEQLEAWHPEPGARTTPPVREWPDDASRANRTEETMAAEAMAYREVQEGGGCVASSTDCCDGLAASASASQCQSQPLHAMQRGSGRHCVADAVRTSVSGCSAWRWIHLPDSRPPVCSPPYAEPPVWRAAVCRRRSSRLGVSACRSRNSSGIPCRTVPYRTHTRYSPCCLLSTATPLPMPLIYC